MTTATKAADISPTSELQMAAEQAARGKLDLAEAREAAASAYTATMVSGPMEAMQHFSMVPPVQPH